MSEPAYTPRKEYQCEGKTTHYMGCQCHEARHAEELASRDARNAELQARVQELEAALVAVRDRSILWRRDQAADVVRAVHQIAADALSPKGGES